MIEGRIAVDVRSRGTSHATTTVWDSRAFDAAYAQFICKDGFPFGRRSTTGAIDRVIGLS
jgi:hypothetical protein